MNKFWLLICCISSVAAIPVNADEGQKRIEPHQVNIRNYERYIVQIKNDLPVGTPYKDVEKYLSDKGLEYGHAASEGCLQFMINRIYSAFFIFKTDLQIKIYVSEENGVTDIKSRLIETAF